MSARRKKTFKTIHPTLPNADEAPSPASAPTSPSPAPQSTVTQEHIAAPKATSTATSNQRSSFTWRLWPDQSDQFDALVLRIKRDLGRKADKADILWALVELADETPAIYGALIARLQHTPK